MCCYGIEKLYEKLKELICGKKVNVEVIVEFIDNLDMLEVVKVEFKVLMFVIYIGDVIRFVD